MKTRHSVYTEPLSSSYPKMSSYYHLTFNHFTALYKSDLTLNWFFSRFSNYDEWEAPKSFYWRKLGKIFKFEN